MPLPVLLIGETGTGKEVLAKAMHRVACPDEAEGAGARSRGGFIGVNCGSIPKDLIESELFGYEGGMFTGARKEGSDGLLVRYGAGTVLLDEIGDAPKGVQVKLLRFLNDGEVRKVGGASTQKIFPWVLAATHRDLGGRVENGKFRADLLERLTGVQLLLPPLRARQEDIGPLFFAAIAKHADNAKLEIDSGPHVADALRSFPWAGNLRQLDMVARRLVLSRGLHGAEKTMLDLEDLPIDIQRYYRARTPMLGQLKEEYRSAKRYQPDELVQIRRQLREQWIERLERGAEPASRVAHIVRRLVKSDVVRAVVGADHAKIVAAVEEMVERIVDEQIDELEAALTDVDGVAGEPREPSEALAAPVPAWLKVLMQLLELACRTPLFSEVGDEVDRLVAAIPPAWRQVLEPLVVLLLEEGEGGPGGPSSEPPLNDAHFEKWEELRDDPDKLQAAIQRAGSAAALGRAVGVSDRTVRDAQKRHRTRAQDDAFRSASGSPAGQDPEGHGDPEDAGGAGGAK
jgi:transcriptional regulator with AAA-type ATPase domain